MKRVQAIVVLMLAASIGAAPSAAVAQEKDTSSTPAATKAPGSPKMANVERIALAMSAGPPGITANATLITCGGPRCADMNDMSNGRPAQLRAGANGWVCYAFTDEPMCLDKQWQKWMDALTSKGQPRIDGPGMAYMLRGDKGGSNTDPYATGRTADNQWVVAPPHVMVLFQDLKMLDAYPTDPRNGGPWVMWKGTAYAHLMVPASRAKAAMMSSK